MIVLITGGAGFIGSFIVEEVLEKGWVPVVVDNLSTGKATYLPKGVSFYDLDICSKSLEEIFQKHRPHVVIHQAAQVSVEKAQGNPLNDCEINILGTLNVLRLCHRYHVQKFIFASSAAVYGMTESVPITEMNEIKPISFYGFSKFTAEQYVHFYQQHFGLNCTILRYSNVYGMRQNQTSEAGVISIFINKMLRNQPLTVFGDGDQSRDFIFVRDVAKANIQAITSSHNLTFNISTNKPITLNGVITELQNISNYQIKVNYKEGRVGDIKESFLSYDLANQLLKWQPETNFATGLKETMDYYLNF